MALQAGTYERLLCKPVARLVDFDGLPVPGLDHTARTCDAVVEANLRDGDPMVPCKLRV